MRMQRHNNDMMNSGNFEGRVEGESWKQMLGATKKNEHGDKGSFSSTVFTSWAAGRVLSLAILPQEYNEQRKTHKFVPYTFGVIITAVSDLHWLQPNLTV